MFSINSGVFYGFHEYIDTSSRQMALNINGRFSKAAILGSSLRNRHNTSSGENNLIREPLFRVTSQSNVIFLIASKKFYSVGCLILKFIFHTDVISWSCFLSDLLLLGVVNFAYFMWWSTWNCIWILIKRQLSSSSN